MPRVLIWGEGESEALSRSQPVVLGVSGVTGACNPRQGAEYLAQNRSPGQRQSAQTYREVAAKGVQPTFDLACFKHSTGTS